MLQPNDVGHIFSSESHSYYRDAVQRRENETLSLLEAVWAFEHALQSRSKQMQRELGLTGSQHMVIRMLALHPNVSAGELARLLHMHPSTLTGILARLVSRRLIRRTPHPQDERRAVLSVSDEGLKFDKPHQVTVDARVGAFVAAHGAADRADFERLLRTLTAFVDASDENS